MGNYKQYYDFDDALITSMLPNDQMKSAPGDGDTLELGKHFAGLFIDFGLQPSERVLDIGCSIGRNAIPLTQYLTTGSLEGFDVVKESVDDATKRITSLYPNFIFQWCDIYNSVYNPHSNIHSEDFIFPYENDTFDFVYSISVFTHMIPEGVEKYISESSRVLKSGGTLFASFFFTDNENNSADRSFPYMMGETAHISDIQYPEGAISYPKQDIGIMCEKYGFSKPVFYDGWWSGKSEYLSYQDIIFAIKK